jgi:hypothetical protein
MNFDIRLGLHLRLYGQGIEELLEFYTAQIRDLLINCKELKYALMLIYEQSMIFGLGKRYIWEDILR